jgi:hypothetical protein
MLNIQKLKEDVEKIGFQINDNRYSILITRGEDERVNFNNWSAVFRWAYAHGYLK